MDELMVDGEPIRRKPNLGCATTEELMRELIARFSTGAVALAAPHVEQAVALAEMLGGLDSMTKEYRTVDY